VEEGPVIRVLVVASSAVGRAGVTTLVAATPTFEVVGQSSGWATLAQDIEGLRPDVIVVQLDALTQRIPVELQALAKTPRGNPAPAVVVLIHPDQRPALAEALRAGIRALVPADATASEIGGAIDAAAAGLLAVHPAFLGRLPGLAPPGRESAETPKPALTAREIEILNLIAHGLGNKEIAGHLGISEHTVKFHVGSIFTKLDASGRAEAVTLGVRAGLILL
jgi:two-component system, NarL family, response regulator YdfI